MRKFIIKFLPLWLKYDIQFLYYSIIDIINYILGKNEFLIPPRRKSFFIGQCDFKKTGEEFLNYFIEYGKLKPTDKVLDVGCGIGRLALPLLNFLKNGSYEGIDNMRIGIEWCKRNISLVNKNFNFTLIDVYNKFYNRKGTLAASQLRFPFEANTFDFVFLISVFTHLLPHDLENYLSEISRVLRNGGRCFITCFLLNNQSISLMNRKHSQFDFKYKFKGYSTTNNKIHEAAVAYDENFIKNLYNKNKLYIIEPLLFGYWCGRTNYLGLQDTIIAQKISEVI